MIVTHLACIAKRLMSSNNPTIKFSAASCRAAIACRLEMDLYRRSTRTIRTYAVFLRNLPYQLLKWSSFDKVFSGSLIPSNFSQSYHTRSISMRLFNSSCGGNSIPKYFVRYMLSRLFTSLHRCFLAYVFMVVEHPCPLQSLVYEFVDS